MRPDDDFGGTGPGGSSPPPKKDKKWIGWAILAAFVIFAAVVAMA